MPGIFTSIAGGIQGASAAHNAANVINKGYQQAGTTVTNAAQQVNPGLLAAGSLAGQGVTGAATAAGQGATGAAGAGAAGATTAGQNLANMLNPYIQAGATAASGLTAASQPFTAQMMAQYSPAYQFQLQQGQAAGARAAAASGTAGSGGAARALEQYTQDYAGTAFANASNLYNQNFNRLATVAGMGQQAAGTAGQAQLQAAEYGGSLQENAAQYAGTTGMQGQEYAGNMNVNQTNLAGQNTMSAANYLANTQIGGAQAIAQGDLGAASAWNNMLSGIGQTANAVAMGGLGADGGWSFSNLAQNFGLGGGGSQSAGAPYTRQFQWPSYNNPPAAMQVPVPETPWILQPGNNPNYSPQDPRWQTGQ